MNKIEKLIKEFCPDGVEWKKLGEVCEIGTGKSNTNEQSDNGKYPFYVRSKDIKRINKFEFDETSIIIPGEGGIGEIFHYVKGKYALHQRAYRIHIIDEKIITKFIYYYLMNNFKKYIMKNAVSSTITSIRKPMIENFEIPIPPIEIQKEIVKILDNFTNYVTELQTELQARNKKYNYYRDMLLSEDYLNKISEKIYEIEENRTLALVSIKEVCIRQRGFSITADEMKKIHKENAPIKIFAGGKTTANIDECNIDKKYIITKPSIIVKSRGNIDFEFYDNPFSHKNELWSYSSNNDKILNIKYLYYYLKKNLKYFEDKAISGKLPQISTGITDNYKIWMPSIIIQNKIVKILDRFQELLSDTKGLLPLEMEQRRKQYEYYREKLLTFDKEEGYAISTAQRQITSEFFELLKKAAKVAEIEISDKVEWKTLGKIAVGNLTYGSGASAIAYDGEVRYVRITDIDANGNLKEEKFSPSEIEEKYFLNYGDILFARSGATVGKNYIHQSGEKSVYAGYLIRLIVNQKLALPKYIYHCINTTEYFKFVENTKSNGSQPNINAKQYSDFKIPLPPLPVQEYIVSILDKFDALVNDLSQGLPKEIELRQKQYEYYRKKLLNF